MMRIEPTAKKPPDESPVRSFVQGFQICYARCADSFGSDHALRLEYVWPAIRSLPAGLRPRKFFHGGSRDPRSALERRGALAHFLGCAAICSEDEFTPAWARWIATTLHGVRGWADHHVSRHLVLALRDSAVHRGIRCYLTDGRYKHHHPGTCA